MAMDQPVSYTHLDVYKRQMDQQTALERQQALYREKNAHLRQYLEPVEPVSYTHLDVYKRQEVIITNNGRPTAILFDIADGSFEETVKAVRQAKAMIAFNSMRAKAAANGYMSDEDIEAEIAAVRRGE